MSAAGKDLDPTKQTAKWAAGSAEVAVFGGRSALVKVAAEAITHPDCTVFLDAEANPHA